MFTNIAIIGTGNIGTWLLKILQTQNNLSVVSVLSRKMETLPNDFDLYIFALKDDVYETVLQQIPFQMSCAVHTSGSLSQQILAPFAEYLGVVYPYQTISRETVSGEQKGESRKQKAESNLSPDTRQKQWDNFKVPVCIEGSNLVFEEKLFQWANSIFNIVYKINEQQRFAMHMAAVFANNFTNAMYGVAYQIFKRNHLNWLLIFPLLEHTLEKAKHHDPRLVQTGPAVRGDVSIMKKHCDYLENEELKTLYKIVSKIIDNSLPEANEKD